MDSNNPIQFAELQTLYEISKKINSQLNLQKLLEEIMDLAVELVTAEKGLILFKNEESDKMETKVARALDGSDMSEVEAMSRTIVDKVANTGQSVLLEKVPTKEGMNATTSLLRYKIKSVLCVPLCIKESLIGVIYLDTTQKRHYFKQENLHFMEAFANMAATAIENAKTYQELEELNANLEKKVDKRTAELREKNRELSDAYKELQEAQLHLIRSEQMASLGMLVAGIAHEINNPLGIINSNVDLFQRNLKKLEKELSKEENSNGSAKFIQISLDAMTQLTRQNQNASTRISDIIKALKNFARLDEGEIKIINIHDGIDSSLDVIRHLYHERIEIEKNYSKIPDIKCRPGQLNQVFMNLLVNACQAIEKKGKIEIQTYKENGFLYVKIKDNGSGIDSENLKKIFDPGFTTKGVGIGTGLGLSISYRIIEEHDGHIDVESGFGKGTIFTIKLPISS